jgi:adenylate kinase family enzyme
VGVDRILIYGVTGSGKTHLAAMLSRKTGIAWHSVDDLTWMPNWTPVADEAQTAKIRDLCSEDRWILDTAYAKWIDSPLARVEMIVALDYPRWLSFGRLLKRTFARALDGRHVCNGNRESLRLIFSKDSILLWHFKSFARKRRRIEGWIAEGRPVVRLKSSKQAEEWLRLYS